MSTFSPTDQQQAAIDYEGNMVITACPGSGKTAVMQEKVRAVTTELQAHKGVIAITFTKKASEELKTRCKNGAHDTKQSFFGTIDSFCYKELIIPFLSRLWSGCPKECRVLKRLNDDHLSYLKEEYRSPTVADITNDNGFKELYEDGILWMNAFSALASYILNESLAAKRYIQAKYSHVFIDEYQDSSESQHQLFMGFFELGLISTAVGDTWQSIYEFRGGNSKLLAELVANSNFKHFEIDKNHRCHPSIVNYASRLLNPQFPLLDCDSEDIQVFRRKLNGNLIDAGRKVSTWITKWLENGRVSKASDIVLLARKESSLKLLKEGLTVNHRLYIDNPLNEIGSDCSDLYTAILAYRYGGISTLQELVNKQFEYSSMSAKNIVEFKRIVRKLRDEERLDDLVERCRSVATLLNIEVTKNADDALLNTIENRSFLKQFMPLDENEVQVMSLHKSKGLEFKYVLHFDLEEWSFPYQRVVNDDWDNPIYPELAQETNLHYVGITRAEERCVLIQVGRRQNRRGTFSQSSPSFFLLQPQLEGLYR